MEEDTEQATWEGVGVRRLTSTRSQKYTFPSSEQLTTCVSRSLRQQSSLYSWFLWPVYLGVGGVRRAWVWGRGEAHNPEDSLAQELPCVLV